MQTWIRGFRFNKPTKALPEDIQGFDFVGSGGRSRSQGGKASKINAGCPASRPEQLRLCDSRVRHASATAPDGKRRAVPA
jgi:hypothetical protein